MPLCSRSVVSALWETVLVGIRPIRGSRDTLIGTWRGADLSGHLVGLGESVEAAWRSYRGRLADRIEGLAKGDTLVIGEFRQ